MNNIIPEVFPSSVVPDRYSNGQFVIVSRLENADNSRGIVIAPWKVGYVLKPGEYIGRLVISEHTIECSCEFCKNAKKDIVFWR